MWRLLVACALLSAAALPASAQVEPSTRRVEQSRKVAAEVSLNLRDQLIKEMKASGALRSLIVCKRTCPEILSAPSRKTGWRISAVSLKPRNPALGAPDTWEQKVLLDFDRRVANGAKTEGLEVSEVVTEPQGKLFRYAVAMPVEPLCLVCHGPKESLPGRVRDQLAIDYPHDHAVGFAEGQVYGIVAIKRSL